MFSFIAESNVIEKDDIQKISPDLSGQRSVASQLLTSKVASLPEKFGENRSIHSSFKLPITYLDSDHIYPLSTTVSKDLELIETTHRDTTPIYDVLFLPKHSFAKEMTREWSKQYTNHIPFLEESQQVLKNCSKYVECLPTTQGRFTVDCERIVHIWDSVKNDHNFLEKYNFMEWQMLMYLNKSSAFLQCLSLIHFISPLTSILIPILFLIFPFIILKIQSIPIDFAKYIEVLKEVAKNHFIGKTLVSMEQSSMNNIGYVLMTTGLYFLQIYQNVVSFFRFYRNINSINQQLVDMKNYVAYSIGSMEAFVTANKGVSLYATFCQDVARHCQVLKQLHNELGGIESTSFGLNKLNQLGYMLQCYHELFDNEDYADSISYSAGFEGYINNLLGVYENIQNGKIHGAKFNNDDDVDFKEQYYPPFGMTNEKYVTNSCGFDKNMIITGVNASGKTTVLKTTTINIIFSQQVGYGFYKSCSLCPYTHIHSYLNIPDTSGRDSLFQAESRRCKEILDIIGTDKKNTMYRHFCIFDELYSGTNPIEATKSAYAFLLYLSDFDNVDFILTTHYTSICNKFQKSKRIRNYKMDVERTEQGKLMYKYKIRPGICRIQGAIEILKDMNYPAEIIHSIRTYKEEKMIKK